MTNAEFKSIMTNGFKVNYTKGSSDLRCFKCGKESYLAPSTGTTISCINNHNFAVIDFTVLHAQMRDDLLDSLLASNKDMTTSCDL